MSCLRNIFKRQHKSVKDRTLEIHNEIEDLKNDVSEAKKEVKVNWINSIRFRLIAGFIIPVVFIVILGIVSYRTASKAIIANYEDATTSTIRKTAEYYDLLFSTIQSNSEDVVSNENLRDYYSQIYSSDIIKEGQVYNAGLSRLQTFVMNNEFIKNAYVLCKYGKTMVTANVSKFPSYDEFAASDEAQNIKSSKLVWSTSRPYMDDYITPNYGLSLERQVVAKTGKACGYLIVDIDRDRILSTIKELDLGTGSVVAIITPDGGELNNSEDGVCYFAGTDFVEQVINAGNDDSQTGSMYVDGGNKLFIYSKISNGFAVCALVPKTVITSQASMILTTTVIIVVIAFVVAGLIGTILAIGIDTTIHAIMKKLGVVANGDLTAQVAVRRNDEFRVLAGSVNRMIGKTKEMIISSSEIAQDVNASGEKVASNSTVLLDSTRNITEAITGIEEGIIQQASDSDECMKQMDMLAERIGLVADNTQKIAYAADSAMNVVGEGLSAIDELKDKAKDTVKVTADVIDGIESLEEASKKISSIITAINEIADQTSLLSLNASIEAARAGEEGKGFAVVADEIRKLADESSESANQIKNIVDDIEQQTKDTVAIALRAEEIIDSQGEALEKTVRVFKQIEKQVGSLADNIGGIQSGMSDINTAKNETLTLIQSISAVAEETTAAVEEVTATAERQLEAVEELNDEANELSGNAEHLIETISAFKID